MEASGNVLIQEIPQYLRVGTEEIHETFQAN
jgi:hypothetical protein